MLSTPENIYIYELRYMNQVPFYVGKTICPRTRRTEHKHVGENRKIYSPNLLKIFLKLRKEKRSFRFVVVEKVKFALGCIHERERIELRLKQGFKLANIRLIEKKKDNEQYGNKINEPVYLDVFPLED